MKKLEQIKQLEQKLTELLGKKIYTKYKKACTGKYRGYYDYGLEFEDGTQYYISTGKQYYFERLTESVQMYQYFHDNRKYLENRTKEVIERDNRQAVELGLSPIEFISLYMITENKKSDNLFWIGFKYKQHGLIFLHIETRFFYACRGIGLTNSGNNSVENYFDEYLNRSDDELGGLKDFNKNKYSAIVMGYLQPVVAGSILGVAPEQDMS